MKKLLFLFIGLLLAADAFAQDYSPTVNWPYLYPEFMEGEVVLARNKRNKALFNIHLDIGALHYVEDGRIRETSTMDIALLIIGDDVFRNVGGKMLKVLAETEGGYVVKECKGNFASVVKNEGAFGTTSLNSTTTKTFLYNENAINAYNGYLMTDVYEDLLAMKDDAESLRVTESLYLVIGLDKIPANKNSVQALDGVDKKAFSAFLKSNKIKWDEPQDLIKVIEYLVSTR